MKELCEGKVSEIAGLRNEFAKKNAEQTKTNTKHNFKKREPCKNKMKSSNNKTKIEEMSAKINKRLINQKHRMGVSQIQSTQHNKCL
jgi:hypothetical protein